jgi:hypothetical protein
MKRFAGMTVLWLCILFVPGAAAQDKKPTFTTFEAPGAGTEGTQGTYAIGINTAGVITGYYVDAADVDHGFVVLLTARSPRSMSWGPAAVRMRALSPIASTRREPSQGPTVSSASCALPVES